MFRKSTLKNLEKTIINKTGTLYSMFIKEVQKLNVKLKQMLQKRHILWRITNQSPNKKKELIVDL